MRTIKSLLAKLSSVGVALAGAVALAPSAQADTVSAGTAPPLRFISYNICGNVCSDGKGYDNQRRVDTVVDEAADSGWNADQIHLQEVCRSQYDKILTRLAPKGFRGLFTATLSGRSDICDGDDYGAAVLVKGSVVDTKVLDLTVGGENEPIKVPCVKNYIQSRVNWACSVHLYWNEASYREAEARALAAQAEQWEDSGVPVVLAGDFNGTPRSAALSSFYDPSVVDGGRGSFIEADDTDRDHFDPAVCAPATDTRCRSGEPTFGTKKIDYIFLGSRHFKGAKGDVLPLDTAVSDHRLVRGAAFWSDCGPAAPASGSVIRRDSHGVLYRYAGGSGTGSELGKACKVGVGWSSMRLVDLDGTDLLAVDGNGDLWRYTADTASGSYSGSARTKVDTGWQTYDVLLAPGDFSGDGRADLIGRDGAGDLWLYKGDGKGYYSPRTKIGHGWQTYDVLLAPGDFSGDGRADLIGRDGAGDLWLYKGDGKGYYSPRTKIGHGWQTYSALVAPGDLDGDSKVDLVGRDGAGELWFYAGDGASGYAPRTKIGYGYPAGELIF
ncbi:FG-GAP-like repeat-containing protein [Streptomyces sp. HNM0663]|uniref:FG-GAP-like repeat-containing protein n=1 Tax=Streptomyces chengmaiensis TaxID=3040919 RepID=A0ABT6HQF5_9ACTN|nr:FG-GAP-like repeat-containing protein [Streptomyces chengmaiensis]MDH2390958.1 FG-GAP-like repeat-containing protein [Streptomyces chengmaiensis]